MSSRSQLTAAGPKGDPGGYEQEHVHAVYQAIASHFSSTRYKPWPVIEQFISSLPPGSVGLDSGTGNGKYLPLPLGRPSDILTVGLDRSQELLRIAQSAGHRRQEVLVGDALQSCWRPGLFDYAISIATIHHLSTTERRRDAIKNLLSAVSPFGGRILIYVWAVDQDDTSKRDVSPALCSGSQPGVDAFVPWVLNAGPKADTASKPSNDQERKIFKRYYHFFAAGELRQLVCEAAETLGFVVGPPSTECGQRGLEIVKDDYEKSNWYIELRLWGAKVGA